MTAIAQVALIANPAVVPSRSRLAGWIIRAGELLKQFGPYAAIEILLPGGTLIALLLWVYRGRRSLRSDHRRSSQSIAHAELCMEHRVLMSGVGRYCSWERS
jgi:hypothetical protein